MSLISVLKVVNPKKTFIIEKWFHLPCTRSNKK